MSKSEWTVINDWNDAYSAGTNNYLAYVIEYPKNKVRAVVLFPGAPYCKGEKWFKNINEAKEWAISTLVKHAESVIDEAKKAQEFLDLVEGGELLEKSRDA